MQGHLTIIGLGLLGGSIGLAVRERLSDVKIVGCAHREGSLVEARKVGAIDTWTLDPAEAVRGAGMVVLCTPVSLIGPWLERIAAHLDPGAIVTDVGSTKAAIVEAGDRLVRPPAHFVGSHPMAGSDKTGVAVARADLFDQATCIVTRSDQTDSAAAEQVERFWQTLGMRIVRHNPAEHDRLVALVSHMPHVVAAAVVRAQSDASLDLRGRGFTDATRIAGGDAGLWRDILLDNRDNVLAAIDTIVADLMRLRTDLVEQDSDALTSWLAEASEVRKQIG